VTLNAARFDGILPDAHGTSISRNALTLDARFSIGPENCTQAASEATFLNKNKHSGTTVKAKH
jgi:hypothetical protein